MAGSDETAIKNHSEAPLAPLALVEQEQQDAAENNQKASEDYHQQIGDDVGTGGLSDDVAISLGERTPRFEDPSGHANVTVQLGGTAFLNCKVLDLQDKTVYSTPSAEKPCYKHYRPSLLVCNARLSLCCCCIDSNERGAFAEAIPR